MTFTNSIPIILKFKDLKYNKLYNYQTKLEISKHEGDSCPMFSMNNYVLTTVFQ